MSVPTKVGFVSLGCPKNLVDTEAMLAKLAAAGYENTSEETEADIVVINTCAFIESAKRESIDSIIDIAWLKKNHGLRGIVVTGCLAQRYQEELFCELPEVDAAIGTGSVQDIVEAVQSIDGNIKKDADAKYRSFKDNENAELYSERILTTEHFAYLKISEGCDNRCTYCAIPSIRGRQRSREISQIVQEAKQLEALGIKELCLIAQDTTAYGFDLYGEYMLASLLQKITAETKIPWIRLLYCYPDKITQELIAQIRDNDRVVKYIDIPIQHISEKILCRMNRHGGAEKVRTAISRLREQIPGIAIRTTAIVGFPGEDEADFTELCDFIKEAKFDHFGAFTYSREEGTPAYDFDGQTDEAVKQDRYDIIMRGQLDIVCRKNEEKIGEVIRVLCEGFDCAAEVYYGRSETDAPEIDGKVYFPSLRERPVLPGEFVDIKITQVLDYDLYGEIVKHI